ncbi:pyridoxamine 5'-phosphate oxidase family protein [Phenylobacterium sp.]|jgi:PPOX class probable FMN-dependent enzyme|uniref:pyridoxamine 5'-phosphate oxidase family protein n=1 Tax=Phenylobacterium sp. TaxID=1871053 RepID=UPI002F938795
MSFIETIAELEALYGPTNEASTVKVADHVTELYRPFVEASPFVALATCGPEGLDCSPRGDQPGFVRIQTPRQLVMPDRRGNNRCDSLRNIVRDPRTAFLFLVPGSGTCLRVNGTARLSIEPGLLDSLAVEGKPPRCAIVLETQAVYFQCARAIVRSHLWDPARHVDPASLPTPGAILAGMSGARVGGEAYDKAWPERARATLW